MPQPTAADRCPLIVVRADTRDTALHSGGGADGTGRRADFTLLQERLQAQVVDENDVRASRLTRLVQRVAGTYVALAVAAFRRRRTASAYVTGSENEAIVLAALLKLARTRVPLVAVAIYPAKPAKRAAWRWARVQTHLDRVLSHGSAQVDRLVNGLGVPAEQVDVLPFGVDTRFWDPALATPPPAGRPYVFAAGLQHRDYATLLEAADGLDVDLVIAAASLWATSRNELAGASLPPWVSVRSMSYRELRDAYAGAAAVVAPVVETDFPPGTTSITEAMAMARPVVAARAEGTGDYVTDRRTVLRRGPVRSTSAGYAARFGSAGVQGQTGFFYAPGDADELRAVLRWVLEHPAEAAEIGARGRAVAEEVLSLEGYVDRIVTAVEESTKQLAARGGGG